VVANDLRVKAFPSAFEAALDTVTVESHPGEPVPGGGPQAPHEDALESTQWDPVQRAFRKMNERAIQYARQNGVVPVAALGNSDNDLAHPPDALRAVTHATANADQVTPPCPEYEE
jgi:hypothetical protein